MTGTAHISRHDLTGRILVADDNPINRALLVRGLKDRGHTVGTAENGREAIEKLRAEPFDVLLLDILMPEMDGYETLRVVKEDQTLRARIATQARRTVEDRFSWASIADCAYKTYNALLRSG